MPTPKTEACKNGHQWTEANTRTSTDRYGITRRICAICRNAYVNERLTLKYRNDPAWRELQKAKSRARYHNTRKHKAKTYEAPECHTSQTSPQSPEPRALQSPTESQATS